MQLPLASTLDLAPKRNTRRRVAALHVEIIKRITLLRYSQQKQKALRMFVRQAPGNNNGTDITVTKWNRNYAMAKQSKATKQKQKAETPQWARQQQQQQLSQQKQQHPMQLAHALI